MSAEIKVRKRTEKGPTALERLERITERVLEEIDRQRELAVRYGASIPGLNTDMAEMERLREKREMWPALEKGFDTMIKLIREVEKARDVFEEAEIVAIRIKEAELLGADTETAEKFMAQAKEAGDAGSALYFLDLAKKDAEIKIKQFEEIRERAKKVLAKIRELKERGENTEPLENSFEKARLATQYESASHYLRLCEEEIERLEGDGKV